MADIFLSYAREDVAKAKRLAAALEKQGWAVFWDRTSLLAGQDFDVVIEQAIEQAGCMIVAWSSASKSSDWVRGEATIARERKILVPVLFEAVSPPIAFRSLHTENLVDWQGEMDAPAYVALCKAITQRVGSPKVSVAVDVQPKNSLNNNIPKPKKPTPPKITRSLKDFFSLRYAMLALLLIVSVSIWQSGIIGKSKFTFLIEDIEPTKQASTDETITDQHKNVKPIQTSAAKIKEPEMVTIPAGTFQMGSPTNEAGRDKDEDQHSVTIAQAFAISRFEITVGQFRQFIQETSYKTTAETDGKGCYTWNVEKQSYEQKAGSYWDKPGFTQTDNHPVVCVSWQDAQRYVDWLSQRTGALYRLPIEAEWEYAARAGSQSAYWWGNTIGEGNAVCFDCGSQWDNKQTAPVASFKANKFGLYDTAGNVWEWTQDCWHDSYNNAPSDGSAWLETYKGDCGRRVIRGGSWGGNPQFLRSALRFRNYADVAFYDLGFRIARAL